MTRPALALAALQPIEKRDDFTVEEKAQFLLNTVADAMPGVKKLIDKGLGGGLSHVECLDAVLGAIAEMNPAGFAKFVAKLNGGN